MTEDDHRVDELAEEFARRLRAGERPSIASYAARDPRLADQLRDVLGAVEMMERLKPRREDSLGESIPERIGEYRIVREVGRGGMGVVYEAEQVSLGRRVALKVLPTHLLANERLRERFRRASQSAARLHHTNIVPVFGVGESEGQCFYVMQRINGRGLDRLLQAVGKAPDADPTLAWSKPAVPAGEATLPGDVEAEAVPTLFAMHPVGKRARTVARIGAQVADALAYAHAQGVLHRDIKPSNLLLDEQGSVWVTDFGVAKLVEEANLTQSGDLVGTLKYMPPERFDGRSDASGDVYSLGVTLYELLTLRSAFPDTNPQHLIHLISEQALTAPRSFDAGIPADLETIVLKAAARDPAHRYASAADLADDLRRFLEDRPIRARRIGSAERLWRWCRRKPALAAALAAAMLLMATLTAVSFVAYAVTASANREASQALAAEKTQREQAEQTATLALAALNQMYDRFAPTRLIVTPVVVNEAGVELPVQPALPPEAVPLLEDLLRTYEQIARSSGKFPRLTAQSAEANQRIGDIRQRLGRHDEAATAYRAAIDLYTRLPDEAEQSSRIKQARTYNELGAILRTLQQREESERMHRLAIDTLSSVRPTFAQRPECRYELARSWYALGRQDMLTSARPGPPKDRPPKDRPPKDRPKDHHHHGKDHPHEGSDDPAGPRAVELLEQLVREFPAVPEYRHLLACAYRDMPPRRGGPMGGPPDRAVTLLRQLMAEFPRMPDYCFDLCETLARPGPGGKKGGKVNAEARFEEAIALSADLVRQYPSVPEYVAAHTRYTDMLGVACFEAGRPSEAEKLHRQAIVVQVKLVNQHPGVASYGFWLSLMERSLARALAARGEGKQARANLTSALERLETLHRKDAKLAGVRSFLGLFYRELADLLETAGETASAAEARRKAETFGPPKRPGGP